MENDSISIQQPNTPATDPYSDLHSPFIRAWHNDAYVSHEIYHIYMYTHALSMAVDWSAATVLSVVCPNALLCINSSTALALALALALQQPESQGCCSFQGAPRIASPSLASISIIISASAIAADADAVARACVGANAVPACRVEEGCVVSKRMRM
jgi:hypothetical protein